MTRIVDLLVCEMDARIGLLADVADIVGAAGVNIVALCAYEMEGAGDFMLVTDGADAAAAALQGFGAEVSRDTAVAIDMDDQPGALAGFARMLADAGINVEYVFGSTCGCGTATVVFKTSDDQAAADVLGD